MLGAGGGVLIVILMKGLILKSATAELKFSNLSPRMDPSSDCIANINLVFLQALP